MIIVVVETVSRRRRRRLLGFLSVCRVQIAFVDSCWWWWCWWLGAFCQPPLTDCLLSADILPVACSSGLAPPPIPHLVEYYYCDFYNYHGQDLLLYVQYPPTNQTNDHHTHTHRTEIQQPRELPEHGEKEYSRCAELLCL